jgi:hypothetical protein
MSSESESSLGLERPPLERPSSERLLSERSSSERPLSLGTRGRVIIDLAIRMHNGTGVRVIEGLYVAKRLGFGLRILLEATDDNSESMTARNARCLPISTGAGPISGID